jgi:beta-xylosidase
MIQMHKLSLLLLIVIISACSLLPPRPTLPSIQLTPLMSATATFLPSATPTPATPTITPTSTPDPKFFRDDFNGTLEAGWIWVREDPENWSMTALPGALQINVAGGYVAKQTNPNVLLRPAPEGDFQIQTQLTFRPTRNYQFAGLIIYEDNSNFLQAGRSYCGSVGCVGPGLYMDLYENGDIVKPDFGQRYAEFDPLLLRLSRNGDAYTFEASTNGKVWFIIGKHTSGMNPLQIGLVTGQRLRGENLPATFEYFEVRSLQ